MKIKQSDRPYIEESYGDFTKQDLQQYSRNKDKEFYY